MNYRFSNEKNLLLKKERGVCFEDVITKINEDGILDIIKHPNTKKYPDQKLYIIELFGYIYMVPFVKSEDEIFLKTVIPSRKLYKLYKGGQDRADG